MRRYAWQVIAGFAIACSAAIAQQPAQPAAQPQPAPQPGPEPGFFRPAADPAINAAPASLARGAANVGRPEPAPLWPEAARAFTAQVEAREPLERDLDRARREAERVQAEVARRPAPLIVSPLDGTAPIISPLDR